MNRYPRILTVKAACALTLVLLASACASVTPTAAPSNTAKVSVPGTSDALTGFGATTADWNKSHVPDTVFAPGSAYNPDASLPTINGHTGAQYVLVTATEGRIMNYSINTPEVSASQDITRALKEFPSDVKTLWRATRASCVQVEVRSAVLGKQLGSKAIGDPQGQALFELQEVTPSGNDASGSKTFNSITFSLDNSNTASAAPPC